MAKIPAKTYSKSYLYGVGDYEKNLYKFFIGSSIVDKNNKSFKENIAYDVKRMQNTAVLSKVLDSSNVVLLRHSYALPRAFKVFTAQDVKKGDKKTRVFIDVTEIIQEDEGNYTMSSKNIDVLASYLFSALAHLIYVADPDRIRNNTSLLDNGTAAFAKMFTYVIDYMRIGSVDKVREKCTYLSAMYYQINLLQKEDNQSSINRAKKLSGLSTRDIDVLDVIVGGDAYDNIKTFIDTIAKVLNVETLKLENFIEKWLKLFGSGTQFATELYPAFSATLTNVYVGAYLNNQKIIENIIGPKLLTGYSTALIRLGSELS